MTNTELEFLEAKRWLNQLYGEGFAEENPIIWAAAATSAVAEIDAEKLRDTINQAVADLERVIITHD